MAFKGINFTDKYGFELGPESMLMGGILNTQTPEQRLMDFIRSSQQAAPQQATAAPIKQDVMSLINPYYTREQSQNNVDPLQMYRQYKQTGQMPQMQSSFTPYTPPDKQYSQVQVNAAPSVKQNPTGGK